MGARLREILAPALLLWATVSSADNGPQHFNGRYYEYVDTKLSWDAARADAASRTFKGKKGTLATLRNNYECNFVRNLRKKEYQNLPNPTSYNTKSWIGIYTDEDNVIKWTDGTKWWDRKRGAYGSLGTKIGRRAGISWPNMGIGMKGYFHSNAHMYYAAGSPTDLAPYIVMYEADNDCWNTTCPENKYCNGLNGTHVCCDYGKTGNNCEISIGNCASDDDRPYTLKVTTTNEGFLQRKTYSCNDKYTVTGCSYRGIGGKSPWSDYEVVNQYGMICNHQYTQYRNDNIPRYLEFLQTGGGNGEVVCDRRTGEVVPTPGMDQFPQCMGLHYAGNTYVVDPRIVRFDEAERIAREELSYQGRTGSLVNDVSGFTENVILQQLVYVNRRYAWLDGNPAGVWGSGRRYWSGTGRYTLRNNTKGNYGKPENDRFFAMRQNNVALSSSSNKMMMMFDGIGFYGSNSNFTTLVKIPDVDSCASASCGSNQHCVNGNGSHWCCPLNRQGFNCEQLIGCDDTFRNTMIGEWRVRKDIAPDFSSANLTYFCLNGHIPLDPPVRACNVTTGLLSGHRPRCGYNYTGSIYMQWPETLTREQAHLQARSLVLNGTRGRLAVVKDKELWKTMYSKGGRMWYYHHTSLEFKNFSRRSANNCSLWSRTPDPDDPFNVTSDKFELVWDYPSRSQATDTENGWWLMMRNHNFIVEKCGDYTFMKHSNYWDYLRTKETKTQSFIEWVTESDCSSVQCGAGEHCVDGVGDAWCCPTHLTGPGCNVRVGCNEQFHLPGQANGKFVGNVKEPYGYNYTYKCASGYVPLHGDMSRRCLPDGTFEGQRPRCGKEINGHLYDIVNHKLLTWNESFDAASKLEIAGVKGKLVDILYPGESEAVYNLANRDTSSEWSWIGLYAGEWVTSAPKRSNRVKLFDKEGNLTILEYSKYGSMTNAKKWPSVLGKHNTGWQQPYPETEKLGMIVEWSGNMCPSICCKTGYHCVDGVRGHSCCQEGFTGSTCNDRMGCYVFNNPQSGSVSVSKSGMERYANIKCNSGYKLVGGQPKRKCLLDGSWEGGEFICANERNQADEQDGTRHLYYYHPANLNYEDARVECDRMQSGTGYRGYLFSPNSAAEMQWVTNKWRTHMHLGVVYNHTLDQHIYTSGPAKGKIAGSGTDFNGIHLRSGASMNNAAYNQVVAYASSPYNFFEMGHPSTTRRFVCEFSKPPSDIETPNNVITAAAAVYKGQEISPPFLNQGFPSALKLFGNVSKGDMVALARECNNPQFQVDSHILLAKSKMTFRIHIFEKDETDPIVKFLILRSYQDLKYKVCYRRGGMLSSASTVEQVGVEIDVIYFPCLQQETFVINTGDPPSPFDYNLTATQGTAPYKFTVTNGAKWPTGLRLDTSTGLISGTIQSNSWFTTDAPDGLDNEGNPLPRRFDVLITDSLGMKAARVFNFSVFDKTPPYATITSAASRSLQQGNFDLLITFTEPCLNFKKSLINVTNGQVTAFSEVARKTYQFHQFKATVTPGDSSIYAGSGNHEVRVDLVTGAGSCEDKYGNTLSSNYQPLVVNYQAPTMAPTANPTVNPTQNPTVNPTTRNPTRIGDTWAPTKNPHTNHPTVNPTANPSTLSPTGNPTTGNPTQAPTRNPTLEPTAPTMPPTDPISQTTIRVSVSMELNYHSLIDPDAFEETTFNSIIEALDKGEVRRHEQELASHQAYLDYQAVKTANPTAGPTEQPTASPTDIPPPTAPTSPTSPTSLPTASPSASPTQPTEQPTFAPTFSPTFSPSADFNLVLSVVQLLPGSTILAIDVTHPDPDVRERIANDIKTFVSADDEWWRKGMEDRGAEQFDKNTVVHAELEFPPTPAPGAKAQEAGTAEQSSQASLSVVMPVLGVLALMAGLILVIIRRRKKAKAKPKVKSRNTFDILQSRGSRRSLHSSRTSSRRSSRKSPSSRKILAGTDDIQVNFSPRTGRSPGRSSRSVKVKPALPGSRPKAPALPSSKPLVKPGLPKVPPALPAAKPAANPPPLPMSKPALTQRNGPTQVPPALPVGKPKPNQSV